MTKIQLQIIELSSISI